MKQNPIACLAIVILTMSSFQKDSDPDNPTKISNLFSDHMVLQQKTKVNIWGWSIPGNKVSIESNWGRKATTTTERNGKWHLHLETPPAGGPYDILIKTAGFIIKIKDVLIGEVWLASGQSNMDIPLQGWPPGDTIFNSAQEIRNAYYPFIRFMKIPFSISNIPLDSTGGKWVSSSPQTVSNFSATAYFFARALYRKLKVPIGIIQSSIGGTPVEAWISKENLSKLKEFQPTDNDSSQTTSVKLNSSSPSVLFNAMIHPIVPFTIKGVIWYQGESNVGRSEQYKRLFPCLIEDWRNKWSTVLPFYYVQLAPFIYTAADQHGQSQKLRDAQRYALKLPKTGMVSTLDIGYLKTAHPPYKQQVGERLAGFAFKNDYDYKNLVASGPLFNKTTVRGNKLIVEFESTGSGLTEGSNGLYNFEIAGVNKVFFNAEATIDKNHLVLYNPLIASPRYGRYAWSDSSSATLFNREGLPAATFTSEPFY